MRISFQHIKAYNPRYILLLCGLLIGTIGVLLIQIKWGLQAYYYTNTQWEGEPAVSRRERGLHLKDKEGDNLLSTDNYSVKWSGWIAIRQTGTYRFATNSDDGSYLRINGTTVVDNGGSHGLRKVSQRIDLKKGVYPIEVLYFQVGGYSIMEALWTPPEKSEHVIPAEVLFSKRPGRAGIIVRKGIMTLSWTLKGIWGSLFFVVSLMVFIKILKSKIVVYVKRRFTIYVVNNLIPLGLAGFFLIGMLFIAYASKHKPVEQSNRLPWTAQANYNSHEAKLAIDGQLDTKWATNQAMKPGMFFQVDLKKSTRIEKLILSHGQFDDYPRGYRVEISPDTINWIKADLLDCQVTSDTTEIYTNPFKARHIRIIQTSQAQSYWWSIYELCLYHPSWLPRSYQYPLMLVFFCGLAGSILFMSLSFCPTFQSCGKFVVIGLVSAIIFGFFLRIFMVQYHDLHVDEIAYLTNALSYIDSDIEWIKQALTEDITRSPILHLLCFRWLFNISNNSALSIRLMSTVLGTLTILLVFSVWRNVSSRQEACFEALLAAAMLSPLVYHVYWSRDGHGEISMTFFYILYIATACKVLLASSRYKTSSLWSGVILFLGFSFHGTMFIAPFGILIFASLDMLITRLKVPRWQNCTLKRYVPLLISGLVFFAYVFYLLFMKSAIADVHSWQESAPTDSRIIASFIGFLKARWQPFLENLTSSWWKSYGFPNYFSMIFQGLALLGIVDVIVKRQKTEWFILSQPVFFCLMMLFLTSSSHFERHIHPLILTLIWSAARGINVISRWFKTPRSVMISRLVISIAVVLHLSCISVYNIFLEPPQYHRRFSWIYRIYGGRKVSLLRLLNYVKKSERGSNSIISTDWWRSFHHANMFKLNIKFLEPHKLVETIYDNQSPVFVIIAGSPTYESESLTDTLERRYNLVGTSLTGNSLYEVRDEYQPEPKSRPSMSNPVLPLKNGKIRLRCTPETLSKYDIIRIIKEKEFNHPDRLSQYGLSPAITGTFGHDYELNILNGNNVVIDHVTGLMWQQSGTSEPMSWKTIQNYINELNKEYFAGYSDWRLPTIEELASLIEPEKKNGALYIDPVFDPIQQWCWSADSVTDSLNTSWIVHFYHGNVAIRNRATVLYVRAVRSIQ